MEDAFVKAVLPVLMIVGIASGGVPERAEAQSWAPRYAVAGPVPQAVEYFVSRARLTLGDGERADLGGVGGRVLWSLAPVAARSGLPLLERVAVGGYLVHASAALEERELWHYGIETDVRLTRAPLAGRIEPLVTLGIGSIRQEEPGTSHLLAPTGPVVYGSTDPAAVPSKSAPSAETEFAAYTQTITSLALTPGIGVRIRLLPRVDLRSDLRSVVGLREEGRPHLELGAGISLRL